MLKTLASYIKEFKKDSLMTPVSMIFEVIMEMLIPLLMASIIDDGVEKSDIRHIYLMGALMIIAAFAGLTAGVMGGKYGARASAGFAKNLREGMFVNIQGYSFENIDKYSTAGLVTRLTTDVTNLQNAYQMILRMCVRAPFSLIIAMVMSFFISAKLASVYLVAVILLGAFLAVITVNAYKYFSAVFEKYDDLNASVQENIAAIRVVKAYVREDYEISKFKKACGNLYLMFIKAESIVTYNAPAMMFTVFSCILGISWLGAKLIVSTNATELQTGDLMSLLAYCMNILMSLMMLSMAFVMITMSSASAKRIAEILNEKSTLENPPQPDFCVPDGSIRFEHVDFCYRKGTDGKHADAADGNQKHADAGQALAQESGNGLVLSDIHLDIHSGETVGIIGGTGSGKTSLVHLIPRFYDATRGEVLINGRNVKEYSLEELRQKVGIVMQRAVLFRGTIRENLCWGKEDAAEEELMEALDIAQAREVVEGKDGKLEAFVEQGGKNFSGGQRQRLTIARALVRKPEILILDDSASALDYATDARLRRAIREMEESPTVFIVSQRTSSIQHADKIIVLEDGEIAGMGTHENLLETCGVYREIYESQYRKQEAAG